MNLLNIPLYISVCNIGKKNLANKSTTFINIDVKPQVYLNWQNILMSSKILYLKVQFNILS